jgi:hypothetical protein
MMMMMKKHEHKWAAIRKGFPQKICMCGMLKVGTHTVLLGDEIRYSSTKLTTTAGQLGMDLATGRAQQFVGGANQAIANLSDVLSSRTYAFTSPDTLTITDNALIPWMPGAGADISELLALVKTAPTGASLIVEFFRGTRATGVVGASLGIVTIVAGDFTASTAIAPTTIATTEFVAMTINQIGSIIAGANLTGIAR